VDNSVYRQSRSITLPVPTVAFTIQKSVLVQLCVSVLSYCFIQYTQCAVLVNYRTKN